jgi:CCR4-NOT transcription complex subunit 1
MTEYKDDGTESKILKMILENGYECCSSVNSVRDLLANTTIHEKDVAEILGSMARTYVNMTGVGNSENNSETTWNVENFVTVVREKVITACSFVYMLCINTISNIGSRNELASSL